MLRTCERVSLLCALLVSSSLAAIITSLPHSPTVSFKQYSGFYSVSKTRFIHYWLAESQNDPANDPLLVTLSSGPGCSGLAEMVSDWGPYMVQKDGKSLELNPYSWTKRASMLTLEAPAGVGFSYVTDGDYKTDDNQTAWDNFAALKSFFGEFPQFKSNELYLTGVSYGGMYAPTLAEVILKHKSELPVNFKGITMGNGFLSMIKVCDTLMLYMYNHAMIDEREWQKVKAECCNGAIDGCDFYSYVDQPNYCGNFTNYNWDWSWNNGIYPYNIYQDCQTINDSSSVAEQALGRMLFRRSHPVSSSNKETKKVSCRSNTIAQTTYFRLPEVRLAMHIPASLPPWTFCNDQTEELYSIIYLDTSPQTRLVVDNGLRVLIYHGDVDMKCNFLLGQRYAEQLGYPLTSRKTSFKLDEQVVGFHTQYGNVEFVTVRGAGHMVPTDKPAVAYHIINSFLSYKKP